MSDPVTIGAIIVAAGSLAAAGTSAAMKEDPPKAKDAGALPNTNPDDAEAKARDEASRRARRGLTGLIATGQRGLMAESTATAQSPMRKTLLGQ